MKKELTENGLYDKGLGEGIFTGVTVMQLVKDFVIAAIALGFFYAFAVIITLAFN